jgi:hypothetical protein
MSKPSVKAVHTGNSRGDAAKARVLLSEALAMYESVGMSFHANRTSGRLAALLRSLPNGRIRRLRRMIGNGRRCRS